MQLLRKTLVGVAAIAVGFLTFIVTAWGLGTFQDVLTAHGVHVIDQGDEWHPLSMALLLVVPLIATWWTLRACARRWRTAKNEMSTR